MTIPRPPNTAPGPVATVTNLPGQNSHGW